jgi:hypothetical protein
MKTKSMQKRLEELNAAGKIESGKSYDLMPSDCSGNGYDIALTSRTDESSDYEIAGHLMRVTCTVRVGSRNWSEGIPAGYSLECDPSAPYQLLAGEKAIVRHRKGNKIGNSGFMARTLASIAIQRENGSYVYRGHSPYWIKSTHTYASHYQSGRNQADESAYRADVKMLESIVAQINRTAIKIAMAA